MSEVFLRRLAPLSLAAALMLSGAGAVKADVTVFTNFSGSPSFNSGNASIVGTRGFANLVDAMPFTAAATADLEEAVLALSFGSGTNSPITLDLESNARGEPGAILATLTQAGTIATAPGLAPFDYTGTPVKLAAGRRYWLVALQSNGNSLDDWYVSNGDAGSVAYDASGSPTGPWAISPTQPISAFQVEGAVLAAPEPATVWLMGLGLAALWVARSRISALVSRA